MNESITSRVRPGAFNHARSARLLVPLLCLLLPSLARATIKVGVSDWTGWVAWYVARQEGYFQKYGARVRLIWFPNYSDSISALSTGQLDANSQTWSDTLSPLARGLPLQVVLVNDNSSGNDAVMAGPAIRSIAALKGRTVALEEYSVSHFVLYTALARAGMTPSEVHLVNLDAGDAAAAFMTGRVDAAVVWNPWISRIEASGTGHALFTSRQMPGLIPDLLVAQRASIAAHRADFVGMIRAWFATVAFIHTHPNQAVRIMAKVVSMSPAQYKVFLPGTRLFGARANLAAFDPHNPTSLVAVEPAIAKFLRTYRLIEGSPDLAHAIDSAPLEQALHR